MTNIIDGRKIAAEIDSESAALIESGAGRGLRATLAAITIGRDPAAESYSRQKQKVAQKLGIDYISVQEPDGVETSEVVAAVRKMAENRDVDGILVHTPVPAHLDARRILESIPLEKDVDCAGLQSMGLLYSGRPLFAPATAQAVMEILKRSGHKTEGRHVVVLGRSMVIGKPLATLLLMKGRGGDATVTVCHSRTTDISEHTLRADIIVAAIGQARFVTREMVSPGTVVIDVGINSIPSPDAAGGYRLTGDVDFSAVSEVASAITPVPGGVGPVTTSVLMNHVARAFAGRISSSYS